MFIQQAFKYQNDFWRYIIGVAIVLVFIIAGQLPLGLAIFLEGGFEIAGMQQDEMLQLLDSNLNLFLILLSFAFGLAGVFLAAKVLHSQPIIALTTTRRKIDWGRFFFAFGLVAIFSVVVTLGDYFSNPEDYFFNFKPGPFFIMLVIAIIMIPLQTSFEEYFFRGYLMQGVGTLVRNKWVPLILTSVVFGGLHFFNPEVTKLGNIIMIYYIGTGFMLGIMTLMDEGLELALGFHAGNNLITAVLVTADWTAFQTNSLLKDVSDPSMGWDVLIPVLIVYPAFLFIMSRKYGWSNWKDKLFGKVERPEVLKPSE